MTQFLIQTINGRVRHDFCFHLMEAVDYHNWFYNELIHDSVLSDTVKNNKDYIPVGSLEFVFDFLKLNWGISTSAINPINIPRDLAAEKFLKRKIFYGNNKELQLTKNYFVKSNTQYKKFTEIVSNISQIPDDDYLFSEVVDIDSEWRGFVYNRNLVDIKHYSGDFKIIPDFLLIEEMIRSYHQCPPAYTLDVGINSKGTFLIEVHPFVSCGLYGFNHYKFLPSMFTQAFDYVRKNSYK